MSVHDHAGHHRPGAASPPRPHEDPADDALAELLDLDAEVLRPFWSDVFASVERAATGSEVRRILDLGAGCGAATIPLAQRFPGAAVIAVDRSEDMLARVRIKASEFDVGARVHTIRADLDEGWPALGAPDLSWASMSLHHLADPDKVLGDVFAATRPGGVLIVVEMNEPLRFLPEDLGLGRPGLEQRCLDLVNAEHAHSLPELGSHWAPRLAAVGFTLLSDSTVSLEQNPALRVAAARYAEVWLGCLRSAFADQLAPDDLGTLDELIHGDGPRSLRRRGDLELRGSRTITLARRPPVGSAQTSGEPIGLRGADTSAPGR